MKKRLFAIVLLAILCTGTIIMVSCRKNDERDNNLANIENQSKKPWKPGKAWLAAYLHVDINRIVDVEYIPGSYWYRREPVLLGNGGVYYITSWGCNPADQTCKIIVHISSHAGLNAKDGGGSPCGYLVVLDDEIILFAESSENGGPEWMMNDVYENGETPIEGASELGLCDSSQYVVVPAICVQSEEIEDYHIVRISRDILEIRDIEE